VPPESRIYVYNLLTSKFLCCFYTRICDVASGNSSTHFFSPKYIKAPSLKKMTFFSRANALFFLIVCSSADTVSVVGGRLVGLLINFFFYLRLKPLSRLEPHYYIL
jgi:uncharacterized membrane protein YagU involved in acid resistance